MLPAALLDLLPSGPALNPNAATAGHGTRLTSWPLRGAGAGARLSGPYGQTF